LIVPLLLDPIKPDKRPPFTRAKIILLNTSITITKKMGDIGSPCLRPQELLKKLDGVPFTKIEKRIDEIQHATHYTIFPQNCISSTYTKGNPQLTWSKPFSISRLHSIFGTSDLSLLSMHSLAMRTESRICLPLMEAL